MLTPMTETNSVSHYEPLHGKSGYSEDPQNALLYFSKAYNFLRHHDHTAFTAHNSQFSYYTGFLQQIGIQNKSQEYPAYSILLVRP